MLSHDSSLLLNNISLPKSHLLLKDYLLDDLSSCSSNGFRSYPRRQCCTKVRYLIEIDLNKHVKLPHSHNHFRSKSKPASVLHKASAVIVNVFKNFHFSGTSKPRKPNLLQRNLSRKLSKHGFWKKSTDQTDKEFIELNFDEQIKQNKEIMLPPVSKHCDAVNNSNSNSSSVVSADSYFSVTSDSWTTESDKLGMEKMNPENGTNADENTKVSTFHFR